MISYVNLTLRVSAVMLSFFFFEYYRSEFMAASDSSNVPVVLITGFGPFRSVLVNPSWEVAKALKNYLEWTRPIHLIIEQMNVTYEDVSKRIPDHWLKYNPTVSCFISLSLSHILSLSLAIS